MSKRIHELAKEWGVPPKDFMAGLERIGVRGKRSQSSLSDDEMQRMREALGLVSRPAVSLGTERVVSERVVTEREAGGEQIVTAREQTTETRLRANVIRRRTAREVLKREEAPPTSVIEEAPPALDLDAGVPPSLPEVPPPAEAEVPPSAIEETPPGETRMPEAPERSEPPVAEPPTIREPVAAAPAPAPAPRPAPSVPAVPPPGFEEMRGVKVLGKIDLRKPSPPAASPAQRAGEAPAGGTEGAAGRAPN